MFQIQWTQAADSATTWWSADRRFKIQRRREFATIDGEGNPEVWYRLTELSEEGVIVATCKAASLADAQAIATRIALKGRRIGGKVGAA